MFGQHALNQKDYEHFMCRLVFLVGDLRKRGLRKADSVQRLADRKVST